jgi:type I restriction enzyme R subunit
MSVHKEIHFEVEICEHLAQQGWLYTEGDAAHYDRARALFPADVLAWMQETQPHAWEVLTKNHGARASETVLGRLRDQLDQRGTLEVLRQGIELLGLKQPLKLAEFKPALAINPDILARHAANRLRVVRQLRYSQHNENCIDLVLFLNGVPIATAELKTDFTQSIGDAIDQYRFDRHPRPKGQAVPQAFFAPNQIRKRNRDWGPEVLASRFDEIQRRFLTAVAAPENRWITIEKSTGFAEAARIVRTLRDSGGQADKGYVVQL